MGGYYGSLHYMLFNVVLEQLEKYIFFLLVSISPLSIFNNFTGHAFFSYFYYPPYVFLLERFSYYDISFPQLSIYCTWGMYNARSYKEFV